MQEFASFTDSQGQSSKWLANTRLALLVDLILEDQLMELDVLDIHVPYFIEYSAHMSIVCTFILQFYLNILFMNKVGECYIPSIVHMQYFSIIFNEKSAHYTQ